MLKIAAYILLFLEFSQNIKYFVNGRWDKAF